MSGVRMVIAAALWLCTLGASAGDCCARPEKGFVPDEKTAVRIAEAVLAPIYGEATIAKERPFKATLEGSNWHVEGYLPPDRVGGVAEAWIDKKDGRIVRHLHGK